MSMEHERVAAGAPRLECGASYDALVDQVAERRSPPPEVAAHQQACPHCRAALAELDGLLEPLRAMTAQRVRAPAGLLSAVMARVRELPRHREHAVVPDPEGLAGPGTTRVAARALGALARTAALQVPGVLHALGGGGTSARAGTAAPLPPGATAGRGTVVGVAGSHVVLEISLIAADGHPLPALAGLVRERVVALVGGLTGLTVVQVDVRIVDVAPPPA